MKKNKAITSDLFGINGTQGEIEIENNPHEEVYEDCDMCNGNGVSQ